MEPNLTSGNLAVLSVTLNLALGLVLGASIGLERQWRQRHAGLATHALVAVGAAAFTSVPGLLPSVGDATRMGAQVVTDIGFLGAGLIMRDGLSVRGLSTAATVWATGAVGVLAGYGLPSRPRRPPSSSSEPTSCSHVRAPGSSDCGRSPGWPSGSTSSSSHARPGTRRPCAPSSSRR
ncbi:MgtC/SapB family protein [Microvirga lotononidis]|uniref:MgtC/SapB family protein n=1 Tax=Microvirga lotononidis TaxID=864069 RepID=UPI001FDA5FFC|nr:MgtC/SapB family protein [Microvirga lotononidis]WQO31540.1 MgtC/SapB family protein [Microvirga lotononidis]